MDISGNGWVVLAFIMLILGVGGSAISISTLRPWGRRIPFKTPITDISTPIGGEARYQFNLGILAYREKSYVRAVEYFTKALAYEPTLAEGFHNRARAQANLAKKQDAAADFVAASDIYAKQGTKLGMDWIKTDLNELAQL
ncbi:MAG: tetratricopeptide repeat protein [Symploca sp. SIO2G7]|nr:tetratricopeptide repeat protein [Symploca sp. SIO2G7]